MEDQKTAISIIPAAAPAVDFSGLSRTAKPPACVLTLADLRRLYVELDRKATEALERFLANEIRPPGTTEEDFNALKEQARALGHVTVTARGVGGEFLAGRSEGVLTSDQLPHKLLTVTFDNTTGLQSANVSLPNRLTVRLDFSEPPTFGVYDPWSEPTPNQTRIEVHGSDETWVSATFMTALSFFEQRKRFRRWLHGEVAFNILNWTLGIPSALWATFRIDQLLLGPNGALSGGLRAAVSIYILLLGLLGFRALFYSLRWLFPLIEFEGARSTAVRGAVGAVAASLFVGLLYDVLKFLLAS